MKNTSKAWGPVDAVGVVGVVSFAVLCLVDRNGELAARPVGGFWSSTSSGLVVAWLVLRVLDTWLAAREKRQSEFEWAGFRDYVCSTTLDAISEFLEVNLPWSVGQTAYFHFEDVYTWAPLSYAAYEDSDCRRIGWAIALEVQNLEVDSKYQSGSTPEEYISRRIDERGESARALAMELSRIVGSYHSVLPPQLLSGLTGLELDLRGFPDGERAQRRGLLVPSHEIGQIVAEAIGVARSVLAICDVRIESEFVYESRLQETLERIRSEIQFPRETRRGA